MWNPFKKNNSGKMPGMGMLQSLAMKRLQNMSEAERMKLMQKFITPENIQKNKGQIMKAMEAMRASGQLSAAQYEEAKKKLGI